MSDTILEEQPDLFDDGFFDEPLWKRKTAAKFLDVTPETIAVWDCTGRYDLRPIKFGRSVRYRPSVIRELLKKRTQSKQP